ncbi:replication terminator protein [Clostridium sp. Cult2]|uniref:replication terminator protein n=1 Tax=Clostridium sp. Cult2 TaxID=2079003 RepID=UPI001F35BF9F|nr:replication terminator protein [Clostridium sp. Cult2]MCF6466374.1 replication terminator protein [Clostridium sp. Cult2]
MNNMINLEKFAGGALTEKFNLALKDVLENIADPNTDHKIKRKLTLELTFVTEEDRELSMVDISTKTKLAPAKSVATKIIIDRDGNGGIVASEYNNQIKGQQYMKVDESTGEILQDDGGVDTKGIKLIK